MWYVIQVSTGHEQLAVDLILEAAAKSDAVKECFCPRYKTGQKMPDGTWRAAEQVLFPGYIIIVTNEIEKIEQGLRNIKAFTRLLGNDEKFIPLSQDEVSWIEAFTNRDCRTIQMSEGYIDGGKLVVTSGPLLRHEYMVTEVKHRQKRARVQLQMFGRTIIAEMGLEIKGKRKALRTS